MNEDVSDKTLQQLSDDVSGLKSITVTNSRRLHRAQLEVTAPSVPFTSFLHKVVQVSLLCCHMFTTANTTHTCAE